MAASPEDALASCAQARPDIVIADLPGPGRRAVWLLLRLRATAHLSDVPVIAVGRRGGFNVARDGFDYVVEEPVDFDQLVPLSIEDVHRRRR